MSMIKYRDPWGLLNQFYRDIEQTFGRPELSGSGDYSAIATSTWVPAVDIREEQHHFVIEADIPGVEPKDIEISMEAGVLTIKGERKLESKQETDNYKRVERTHGLFYRRFSLPDTADADKIVANGKNGVLQVIIPKKEVAQPRKIQIQT